MQSPLPAHPIDLRQLQKITQQLTKKPIKKIEDLFLYGQRKIKNRHHKGVTVWLKKQSTGEVFSLNRKKQPKTQEYLSENELHQAVSVQLPHHRLTGPIVINILQENYQVYLNKKTSGPPLRRFVQQLPIWLRISIPLVISFVLCWLLAKTLSNPLAKIEKVAQKLGDGDLSIRVKKLDQRQDELGRLAESFNYMAEKLEQGVSSQKRLLGDISHELRSPMTRLQIALDLAQDSNLKEEKRNEYLTRCRLEIERLDQMIANVLVLSRLENALHSVDFQPTHLNALLNILVQDAQFIANEKQITINYQSTRTKSIMADSQLLASAINNVLNNAVKYSDEQSEINVTLKQSHHRLQLSITDKGKGVPVESLDKLFDPFYRVTQARERKTGGTGLGLAIAKQAILAHQGKIFAKNNSIGLTVTIELPLIFSKTRQHDDEHS